MGKNTELIDWIYEMTDPEKLQSASDMQNTLEEIRERLESHKKDGFSTALNNMESTVNGIFKAFGMEDGYGEIDMKIDCEWDMDSETIRWMEEDLLYSNEIIGDPSYHLDYMLVYVDNSCGDKFYQVFKMSRRNTELED